MAFYDGQRTQQMRDLRQQFNQGQRQGTLDPNATMDQRGGTLNLNADGQRTDLERQIRQGFNQGQQDIAGGAVGGPGGQAYDPTTPTGDTTSVGQLPGGNAATGGTGVAGGGVGSPVGGGAAGGAGGAGGKGQPAPGGHQQQFQDWRHGLQNTAQANQAAGNPDAFGSSPGVPSWLDPMRAQRVQDRINSRYPIAP